MLFCLSLAASSDTVVADSHFLFSLSTYVSESHRTEWTQRLSANRASPESQSFTDLFNIVWCRYINVAANMLSS